jgi:hypothetical protein
VLRFRAPRAPDPVHTWDATVRFVSAGRALARARVPGLRAAIAVWTHRLADLGGEPVCQDWSRFRPLRLSREEDWSDWLAHLIETSSTGVLAAKLFGLTEAKCRRGRVEREVTVESSRLDLQIHWSDGTYAHVEVKVGDLSLAKTVPAALGHRRLLGTAHCDDFLLLPREDRPEWAVVYAANSAVPITAITWHDVASAIRYSLASSVQEPTVWRAWAVAYLGAIHHRLLSHPRIDLNQTATLGIDMADLLEILEETIT